jgi:anti-anti-sigma regulatory factor
MIECSVDEPGRKGQIVLSDDLTIQNVQQVRSALLEMTSRVDELTLGLDQVSRVDLAVLQVLCSAHRDLVRRGKRLIIAGGISDAFRSTMVAAGFQNCVADEHGNQLWKGER